MVIVFFGRGEYRRCSLLQSASEQRDGSRGAVLIPIQSWSCGRCRARLQNLDGGMVLA